MALLPPRYANSATLQDPGDRARGYCAGRRSAIGIVSGEHLRMPLESSIFEAGIGFTFHGASHPQRASRRVAAFSPNLL
jgi:hypothetical protein